MSKEIQVTAVRRESIDLESLGQALLQIVNGLDTKSKKRLVEHGEKLLKAAEVSQAEQSTSESAA